MKSNSYKRITAYFVDIMIITFISSLITFVIPTSENYTKLTKQFSNLTEEYANQKITKEEYLTKGSEINYSLSKETVAESIVTLVITISYFVVFTYFMNGETIGKKIMKIKITSNNHKKLTMNNYLVRSLIINSILLQFISILTILFLDKTTYLSVYNIISNVFSIIFVVSFMMILFRKDGRGLHDILANTKVISTEKKEQDVTEKETKKEEDLKLKDAELIGK